MHTIANITSPVAWVIGLIVILVLFGGAKIPEMMRGVGQGMKEFKKGMKDDEDDELRKEREREERIRGEVRARMDEEDRRDRESRSRAEAGTAQVRKAIGIRHQALELMPDA